MKHVYLLLTLIFSQVIFAQKKISTFQHTFKAKGMNGGLWVSNTLDSGFIVTGQHETSGAGSCDLYIYKHNKCGAIEFYRTYGWKGTEGGRCVQPTSDGGYIVSGFSQSVPNHGTFQPLLVKVDKAGNTQFYKAYSQAGTDMDDRFYCAAQTSDGGYIATGGVLFGSTDIFKSGGYSKLRTTKTDGAGSILWSFLYSVDPNYKLYSNYVEQTSDGGYIVIGKIGLVTQNTLDLFLMKLDANGNILWFKRYNTASNLSTDAADPAEDGVASSGQVTPDGGFILVANTNKGSIGSDDIALIKTDANGNVQWNKIFGGSGKDQPRCVRSCKDHGYIISGYSMSFGFGEEDSYLLRTDSIGSLQWSKVYGGSNREKAEGARELYDGGFAVDGHTASFGANVFDVYSLKTDSIGNSGCNEMNPPTQASTIAVPDSALILVSEVWGQMTDPPHMDSTYTPDEVILCQKDEGLKVQFVHANLQCSNSPLQFTDQSSASSGTIKSWDWNFGDGTAHDTIKNPTHTYLTPGKYVVSLTINGTQTCFPETLTDTIVANPPPVADFSSAPVCLNNATSFTDKSTVQSPQTISSWNWNFGESSAGSTNGSTLPSPTHTYSAAGTYTARLIVTSIFGCIDSAKFPVVVNPLPVAAFTTPDVCLGDSVHFKNQSTIQAGDIIQSVGWNFGELSSSSNTSANLEPSHFYASPGNYTVLLTVTSTKGCQSTMNKTVTVSPLPVAQFTSTNACINSTILFTDGSSISTGAVIGWQWDFGVSSTTSDTSLKQNPAYTYTSPGTFNTTLIVTSDKGCKDTISKPVTIYPTPVAAFKTSDVCFKNPTLFSDSSTVSSGTISSVFYDFGDATTIGDTSSTKNPTYTYKSPGTYIVTIKAIANGCTTLTSKPVVVYPLPIADFKTGAVCLGAGTSFTDKSSIASGSIVAWSWNFGESSSASNTSTGTNATHTYAAAGSYNTQLSVISDEGCKADTIKPVTVNPTPIPYFGPPAKNCSPICVDLKDSSTVTGSGNSIVSWDWDFGGGNPGTSSSQNPTNICFTNNGHFDPLQYSIGLKVTTDKGCTAYLKRDTIITVYPSPVADFDPDPETASYLDPVFYFTDKSIGNPVTWSWDFGDAGSPKNLDSVQNPLHTYTPDNNFFTYTITLGVTNKYGCVDQVKKKVNIVPEWTFYVPNAVSPNGDGINDVFFGTGIGIVEKEMWIFDRWGIMLYHTTDLNGVWDCKVEGTKSYLNIERNVDIGTYECGLNGSGEETVQQDVYVWIIKIKEVLGKTHRYTGHVTVVK